MATGEWTKEEAQRLLEETTEFLRKTVKTRKSPILAHIGFLNDVLMFLEQAKTRVEDTALLEQSYGHLFYSRDQIREYIKANPKRESEESDTGFCGHCKAITKQTIHSSGHERDSSGDWAKCHVCGWRYSGLTGEWTDDN